MHKKINRALSSPASFRTGLDANGMLDRKSFSDIMKQQDGDLVFTPRESALVFDSVDTDKSGSVSLQELQEYAKEHAEQTEGTFDTAINSTYQAKEKREELEEESGYAARDDIAEQQELVNEYAENLKTISLPSIALGEFPGFTLPSKISFDLPSFKLGDFPGFNLPNLTLKGIGNIVLPSIELRRFPGIDLPDWIPGNIQLPRFKLIDYPHFLMPKMPKMKRPNMNMPKMNMPKINMPDINIKLNIGGMLMKLKLFLGFVQCVSFFPVTFGSVPFPTSFLNLGKYLQLFSIDLTSLLGNACDFSTGFYPSFMFSFLLFPAIIGSSLISYGCVRLRRKLCPSKVSYTTESARTRLYTVLFMIVYSIYTGVATKMFLLFKCEEIQGTWYLVADYRITCYDGEYNGYRNLAILGIVVYVFGILFGILGLLFYNKKYLYETNCPEDEMYKHVQMEKQFGSIYGDYTKDNFYFDLVDLARRLLLTGGLILVGEESNTQIFLGALLCLIWLMLVTVRRPYEAYWDNILSIVLSLQLVLIMLCGMALEMNRLTPEEANNPYEQRSFGALMVGFSIFIIITAFAAIIITIPCLRDALVSVYIKRCSSKEKEAGEQEEKEKEEHSEEKTEGKTAKPTPKQKKRRLSSRDLMKHRATHQKVNVEMVSVSINKEEFHDNPMRAQAKAKTKRRNSFRDPTSGKLYHHNEQSGKTEWLTETTIPKGFCAGQNMSVTTLVGGTIDVIIPQGYSEGDTMHVNDAGLVYDEPLYRGQLIKDTQKLQTEDKNSSSLQAVADEADKSAAVVCHAVAMYDFDGSNSDGRNISFKAGAIIEVNEMDVESYPQTDGWWHGKVKGGTMWGAFPLTYVHCVLKRKELLNNKKVVKDYLLMPSGWAVHKVEGDKPTAKIGTYNPIEKTMTSLKGVVEDWSTVRLVGNRV